MKKEIENCPDGDNKIRKVLFNEVSLFLSIIGVVVGCVLFVNRADNDMDKSIALINQKIQIIESNHLTHIQQSITDINNKNEKIEVKVNEIDKEIGEIKVMLQEIKSNLNK